MTLSYFPFRPQVLSDHMTTRPDRSLTGYIAHVTCCLCADSFIEPYNTPKHTVSNTTLPGLHPSKPH